MAELVGEQLQTSPLIVPSQKTNRPDAAEPPAEAKKSRKAPTVNSTVYMPPDVHKRLREIAFAEQCRIHDLLMEGIDRVIADRGHPERGGKKPI